MVAESVGAEEEEGGEGKKAAKEPTAQQVATVPYLLFLAQGGAGFSRIRFVRHFSIGEVYLCKSYSMLILRLSQVVFV